MRASTSRLNPMAALRAATIATTIQKRPAGRNGYAPSRRSASSMPASANGSANTEWLKRTNEAYTRSAREARTAPEVLGFERSRFTVLPACRLPVLVPCSVLVWACTGNLVDPPYLWRLDAAHEIFFHIDVRRREGYRDQPRRFSGLDRAVVGVEAQRARAFARRALEERRRRHAGRQRAYGSQLGEDVEIRRAGEAVGADRDADARIVELLNWRSARAGMAVAARAGDERRAVRRQPLQIVGGHLDPLDREHARAPETALLDAHHPPSPPPHPRGGSRPPPLQQPAPPATPPSG